MGILPLLAGLFVVSTLFVLAMRALRYLTGRIGSSPGPDTSFDLADIQAMQKAGTITPEEAERLTANLLKQRGAITQPPQGKRGFEVIQS